MKENFSPMQLPVWMTLSQLSEHLQIPTKAVYDLTHKKKIPFHKVGRRLRFHREEIEQWMQKSKSDVYKIPRSLE